VVARPAESPRQLQRRPASVALPDTAGTTAKAEGLALIEDRPDDWNVLVVFDGLKNGHATRYRIDKPG
jgi:hypothetical protein